MQADPNIDGVSDTQGYNRYTYVGNNPLTYTDPSGYFKLREIVGAVVGVVLAIYCVPCTASWYGAMGAGAVAGAAGAAANGGNILQGALYGGISAAAFYGVASGFEGSNLAGTPAAEGAIRAGKDLYLTGTNFAKLVAAQASVGGAMSVLQGGKFGHGFVSAGLTKATTPTILSFDNVAAESIASGLVGGTASELTGGKFANGAATGAFLYAFNACSNGRCNRGSGNHVDTLNNLVKRIPAYKTMSSEILDLLETSPEFSDAANKFLKRSDQVDVETLDIANFTIRSRSGSVEAQTRGSILGDVTGTYLVDRFTSKIYHSFAHRGAYRKYTNSLELLNNSYKEQIEVMRGELNAGPN